MRTFEDDDPLFAPMLNSLFAAFRGTAVMSGCEAAATGISLDVAVAAGSVQISGVEVAVAAGSVTLDTGSAFDRYDLVTVNAAGTLVVTNGAGTRKCPVQPADTCLLAIVFVPAGATVIATGDVYDARMLASLVAVGDLRTSGIIAGKGIQATQKKSYAVSDTVIHAVPGEESAQSTSPQTTHAATVPPGYMTSKFRIKFDYHGNSLRTCHARLLRNGRQVGDVLSFYATDWTPYSVDLDDVEPGTVFQVQAWAYDYGDTSYTRDLRICGEVETYIRTIGSPDVTW